MTLRQMFKLALSPGRLPLERSVADAARIYGARLGILTAIVLANLLLFGMGFLAIRLLQVGSIELLVAIGAGFVVMVKLVGRQRRVRQFERNRTCSRCWGAGRVTGGMPCPACGGTGLQ